MTDELHRSPAPAVATAARVLDALVARGGTVTLDELTLAVGEPRSSVHRVLRTLVSEHLVSRADPLPGYRLGSKLVEYSAAYLRDIDIINEFYVVATRVSSEINETMQLAMLEWPDAVFIAKVDSNRPVRLVTGVGKRVPAYASAVGKVLLAYSSPELVERYRQQGLRRLTEHTVTTIGALRAELEVVRARGYAQADQESAANLCCLSAPVHQADGSVVALSICVPVPAIDPHYRGVLARQVCATAAELSCRLGGQMALGRRE